ncbi:hypothetical protein AA21952_0599 [Acetobacter oeni LMG 21952]|nr:hypothetical protein AA21952_0599 [Acetobacter oeni LMG 21952]
MGSIIERKALPELKPHRCPNRNICLRSMRRMAFSAHRSGLSDRNAASRFKTARRDKSDLLTFG